MDQRNYKGIDLNLLLVFAVLMRERSTTGAAKCLCISQSAVSHSLARLRDITDDRLFLREKHGITPTPRAEKLYQDVLPSLRAIEDALKTKDSFDPKLSNRHFKIRAMRSIHSVILIPELLARIQKASSNISLSVIAGEDFDSTQALSQEDCDIVIASDDVEAGSAHSWHRQIELPPSPMVCIYDAKALGIGTPIGLEDYSSIPHIAPLFAIDGVSKIDDGLAALGKVRTRILITNDYAGMPCVLKKARVIANLPLHAAQLLAPAFGLSISPLPITVRPYCTVMHWHARNDGDLGHLWLRQMIMEVVGSTSRTQRTTRT